MELPYLRISHLRHLREPIGSLMYTMLYSRLYICCAVRMVSRYQSNFHPKHWTVVKHIIKYLKKTNNYILMYSNNDIVPMSYTYFDFISNKNFKKSTLGICLHYKVELYVRGM